MEHVYNLVILESHLDSFGHVNNATYLEILEEARWDWITRGGYGYKEVHSLKQGPVILDLQMQFKKELKLREKIQIKTKVIDWSSKVGKLEQKIINGSGEEATVVTMSVGFFDLKERRLISPTSKWLAAMGKP